MRINNRRVRSSFRLLYILVVLAFIFDLVTINIEGSFSEYYQGHYFWPIFIGGFLLFRWIGLPHFEYDSDGEALVFRSRAPYFSENISFLRKVAEFPKQKLYNFSVERFLFKRTLKIKVKSKNHTIKSLKFNISYLTRTERKDLQRSLKNVLQKNKKKQES